MAQTVKNLPAMHETQVQSLDQKDPLEKEMATHSSILAWEIPWTNEQWTCRPKGHKRVSHDWATKQQKQADWAAKYSEDLKFPMGFGF